MDGSVHIADFRKGYVRHTPAKQKWVLCSFVLWWALLLGVSVRCTGMYREEKRVFSRAGKVDAGNCTRVLDHHDII